MENLRKRVDVNLVRDTEEKKMCKLVVDRAVFSWRKYVQKVFEVR